MVGTGDIIEEKPENRQSQYANIESRTQIKRYLVTKNFRFNNYFPVYVKKGPAERRGYEIQDNIQYYQFPFIHKDFGRLISG